MPPRPISRSSASVVRWALATLVAVALVLGVSSAAAQSLDDYPLPPLSRYVVDAAKTLSAGDVAALDQKLETFRRTTGFSIVVFVTPSLRGLPIDDVAYKAFNTWGVGSRGADTGVLLVVATTERAIRIETGKGVGGALTDVQSARIIRDVIAPRMAAGRVREALEAGTDAIAGELVRGSTPEERARAAPRPTAAPPSPWTVAAAAVGLLLVLALAIVSPTFRSFLMFAILFGRGGRGGGGRGGGGNGGGGGSSGGGGASDRF
jgi:uncharacterized protein